MLLVFINLLIRIFTNLFFFFNDKFNEVNGSIYFIFDEYSDKEISSCPIVINSLSSLIHPLFQVKKYFSNCFCPICDFIKSCITNDFKIFSVSINKIGTSFTKFFSVIELTKYSKSFNIFLTFISKVSYNNL